MPSIEIIRDLHAAAPVWRTLEAANPGFVYQRFTLNEAWFQTIGAHAGATPAIVLLRSGAHHALLPLALQRWHAVQIARYPGGSHFNANGPIADADFPWPQTYDGIRALLMRIGEAIGSVDAFALQTQPQLFNGRPHPFQHGPSLTGVNDFYEGDLASDFPGLAERVLSNDRRKKMRNKERRFAERGTVALIEPDTIESARALLNDYFAQKDIRFRAQGISNPFSAPDAQAFLDAAVTQAISTNDAAVRLIALTLNGNPVAIFGGVQDAQRYSGMFTSFTDDADLARYSPGEQLVCDLVRLCCERGLHVFDLGIGEARYKKIWCDRAIATFDSYMGLSPAGHIYALQCRTLTRAKRIIKTNPPLYNLVKKIRPARSKPDRTPDENQNS
ncbi:MAG: GNAT family N-acetyltransferase [Beijerinckiaceae bacterium]